MKNSLKKFCEDIRKELLLVTWPNKKDMVTSIIIVCLAVAIAGGVFFTADYLLYNAVQFLIKL